jgi:hypothetical protein
MKQLTNSRKNMIFKKFIAIHIIAISCILMDFNLNAQEIPNNQLYEHTQLYFNDLLILRDHKVLLVSDRMNESKRKMFLLDNTNQVTDTMKTIAITDLIPISDTCFFVNDYNYYVIVNIVNDRFVISDIYLTLSDFISEYGKIALMNKDNIIFQKYNEENGGNFYNAMKQKEPLYFLRRVPFPDEKYTYKLNRKDSIKVLSIALPGTIYSSVRKKVRSVMSKNKNIDTFTILSPQETGKKRTDIYYGTDNLEINNDSLFLYEKNSCSLSVFCLKDKFRLIAQILFPVDNQENEGWKYIFDTSTKTHYAVKRTKNSIAENLKNPENKRSYNYLYQVYKIDTFNKRLIDLCKVEVNPICISDGLIYCILSNSQLSSSKILIYPLDFSKIIEKKIFIQ